MKSLQFTSNSMRSRYLPKILVTSSWLFLVLSLGFASASPPGCGCGDGKNRTPTAYTPLTGISEATKKISDEITSEAQEAVKAIEIDTSAAEAWLRDKAKNANWGAEKIAEKLADLLLDATKKLNEYKNSELPKLIQQTTQSFQAAIAKLEPKAKFQADLAWKENCCDEASWSAGAANPAGIVGAEGEGKLSIKFDIGASLGLETTTRVEVNLTLNANFKVTRFNPVRPTQKRGRSITITATPLWEGGVKASAGGGAMVIVTLGVGVSFNETLSDVKGTLTCQDS